MDGSWATLCRKVLPSGADRNRVLISFRPQQHQDGKGIRAATLPRSGWEAELTPLLLTKSRADVPAASVSQSSAMMPLTWHLAILVAGTVGAAAVGAPTWLLGLLGGLVGITTVLSWVTYVRLLGSDRDALRRVGAHVPPSSTERAVLANHPEEVSAGAEARRLTGEAESRVMGSPP